MLANVLVHIGNGGTNIPNEVIEAVNNFVRSNVKSAHATMVVAGVEYTIDYQEMEVKANELS